MKNKIGNIGWFVAYSFVLFGSAWALEYVLVRFFGVERSEAAILIVPAALLCFFAGLVLLKKTRRESDPGRPQIMRQSSLVHLVFFVIGAVACLMLALSLPGLVASGRVFLSLLFSFFGIILGLIVIRGLIRFIKFSTAADSSIDSSNIGDRSDTSDTS